MAQKATGLETNSAVIEEALRQLVRAIRELEGLAE
jgi:Arc/MetJ family transcription regulator